MDKRIKIFMEGVSQLGLSKNQLEAVGNITKVCLEGQFNECWLGNTPAPQNPHIGPKDKYWFSDINREDMPGMFHKGVVYKLFNDNYEPISTYNNVDFSDWEHEFFELYKKAHRSEDCTISKITKVRLPNIDTSTPNPSIDFNSITPDENGNALCYQFINLDPLDGDEPRYFKSVFIPNKDRDSMGFDKWCPYQDEDDDEDVPIGYLGGDGDEDELGEIGKISDDDKEENKEPKDGPDSTDKLFIESFYRAIAKLLDMYPNRLSEGEVAGVIVDKITGKRFSLVFGKQAADPSHFDPNSHRIEVRTKSDRKTYPLWLNKSKSADALIDLMVDIFAEELGKIPKKGVGKKVRQPPKDNSINEEPANF